VSTTAASAQPGYRRAAAVVHLALAVVVVAGVWLQVYLIGAWAFGAGEDALDAHKSVGFTVHAMEVLVFVAALVAWLPRRDLWLSLALAVLGTVQLALAGADEWAGGLHPLFALVVLTLAVLLVQGAMARRRGAAA
jgi:uncharacterized protein DUF6220